MMCFALFLFFVFTTRAAITPLCGLWALRSHALPVARLTMYLLHRGAGRVTDHRSAAWRPAAERAPDFADSVADSRFDLRRFTCYRRLACEPAAAMSRAMLMQEQQLWM